jgi:hypothetical protein
MDGRGKTGSGKYTLTSLVMTTCYGSKNFLFKKEEHVGYQHPVTQQIPAPITCYLMLPSTLLGPQLKLPWGHVGGRKARNPST